MRKKLLTNSSAFLVLTISLIIISIQIKDSCYDEGQTKEISEKSINENKPVDISEVPLDKLVKDEQGIYYGYGRSSVTFNGNPIDQLVFSPSGDKMGFLENRNIYDNNIPYDKQVILYVGNYQEKIFKETYSGSFRTSGWEWFNNEEVLVHYSCGTECQVLDLINVNSREKHSLIYGVGYEWSPDKKYVAAYNYTWRYGITVGDKNKKIFSIRRRHDKYSALTDKNKFIWAPDSSKLAVIIKKEYQEKMELLVFDVKDNFKKVFKQDLENQEGYDLRWNEDGQNLELNGTIILI